MNWLLRFAGVDLSLQFLDGFVILRDDMVLFFELDKLDELVDDLRRDFTWQLFLVVLLGSLDGSLELGVVLGGQDLLDLGSEVSWNDSSVRIPAHGNEVVGHGEVPQKLVSNLCSFGLSFVRSVLLGSVELVGESFLVTREPSSFLDVVSLLEPELAESNLLLSSWWCISCLGWLSDNIDSGHGERKRNLKI